MAGGSHRPCVPWRFASWNVKLGHCFDLQGPSYAIRPIDIGHWKDVARRRSGR